MLKASEVVANRKSLLERRNKEHIELVNKELLEVEKAINKYNNNIEDTNDYIDIPMIIKTDECKQALKEAEWEIDRSQSVECGHTWIRPVEEVGNDIKVKIDRNELNGVKDFSYKYEEPEFDGNEFSNSIKELIKEGLLTSYRF